MNLEHWFAYVVTYTVISIIPGPSVLMVIGQALTHGKRAAFLYILGDIIGGFFIITLSLFGIGAILAVSSELFFAVKWAGVLYMLYLGYTLLAKAHHSKTHKITTTNPTQDFGSLRTGFLIGVLNPKAIIFYMAFLAQFLSPDANVFAQISILVISSSIIVAVVLAGYAMIATKAGQSIKTQKAQKYINYTSGGLFLGGGLFVAITR